MKEGWLKQNIGEIAAFSQGIQVGLKHHKYNPSKGYVRFIRIVDYTQDTDDIRYVKDPGEKYYVTEDDIVMVRYGTPGLIGRGKSGVIANNLFKISINNEGISNDYLSLYLSQSHIQKYLSTQGSSTMPALTFGQLKKVEINYPKSIGEQKAIVKILDEAFAKIDQAKANIEKNIENAKELFQSKLNEIFSQRGEGWEEKVFKEICVLQRGFDLPKRLRSKGKYDLVTSSGVKDSHSEYKVEGPGVITGRSGSIGNVFYVENKFWPLNTALYIKDFKGNYEKYVYYFLRDFDLSQYASGAGVPTLNRNFVHDVIVLSTVDIEEQKDIVETLDLLEMKIEKVKSFYLDKLRSLEDLKKSLLQKAFSGELTKMSEP